MSKHSRANVAHEIAQEKRRADKRKRESRPRPVPLCKRCQSRGIRTEAVYALITLEANCCEACWEEVAQRPFVRAAILAAANGHRWHPDAPITLESRPPCKHCERKLRSDEDWSDQVALFGRFTGLCEACFRSPAVSHRDILRYMGRAA